MTASGVHAATSTGLIGDVSGGGAFRAPLSWILGRAFRIAHDQLKLQLEVAIGTQSALFMCKRSWLESRHGG